jgi:hypothetical protein
MLDKYAISFRIRPVFQIGCFLPFPVSEAEMKQAKGE